MSDRSVEDQLITMARVLLCSPFMQRGRLVVLALAQHLHVGVQRLDGVLALRQLAVQGIAVPLGVHGVQALHPPRFVLNADLHLLQRDLRLLDLAVDLLRQPLQPVSTGGRGGEGVRGTGRA